MTNPVYVCPHTQNNLKLIVEEKEKNKIKKGYYQNQNNIHFPIIDDIPDFTFPEILSEDQKSQLNYYEQHAHHYDDIQSITFALHHADEEAIRKQMVSYLELHPGAKVLELACGTGNDTIYIASLLNHDSELYVQDLSGAMLRQCQHKLKDVPFNIHFSVGNASYLAFPDNYFDAVFSFGGLNVFDDLKRSLKEIVRVTKTNGRVVVGDESMAPWLYETEIGKVLLNANPLLKFKLPLESIPPEARDVAIRWVIGNVYYVISFTVGEDNPKVDLDLKIPGIRGGTLRTRYYGQLEGVSPDTKKLIIEAAKEHKQSLHEWLDQTLKDAARQALTKKKMET